MYKILILLLVPLFSLSHAHELAVEESPPLQFSDIKQIMKELFAKHIKQKEISSELIQNSFDNYISQFDPVKVYLLEQEVTPWKNVSQEEISRLLVAYQRSDYSAYESLNSAIQHAILRSRNLREELYENVEPLFTAKRDPLAEPTSFAENEHELKSRLAKEIMHFIDRQKERFGAHAVIDHYEAVIGKFERSIRSFEDQYLFVDTANAPLPDVQKENLLVIHVLKAMAKSLDKNSSFFTPEEAYAMKMRLEKGFYGVGVIFQEGLDGVTVKNILKDSPADKEGTIAVNDRLLEIDHKPIGNDSFNDVLKKIHIDDNDRISFTLTSEKTKTPYEITLKREPIKIETTRVDSSYEPFGKGIIGVLQLHSFYDDEAGINSEEDVRTALKKLEHTGHLKGLVLDLRDNSGGFLTQAVKVAGLFITNGVIVISKYADGEERFYRDIDGKTAFDGPLVVLVSRQTASAAEIVAQALQDWGVALVVGDDRTYGKGSIQSQTVTNTQDHANSPYFKVTVGKYYTVSGKTPEEDGVKSDIIIPGPQMQGDLSAKWTTKNNNEQLPAAFVDSLSDINDSSKPWFLKYYIPALQRPLAQWKNMLPTLQKNSQLRIDNDKNYAFFLKKKDPSSVDDDNQEEIYLRKGAKNYGVVDLQLQEALNIVKDMIRIESNPNASIGAR